MRLTFPVPFPTSPVSSLNSQCLSRPTLSLHWIPSAFPDLPCLFAEFPVPPPTSPVSSVCCSVLVPYWSNGEKRPPGECRMSYTEILKKGSNIRTQHGNLCSNLSIHEFAFLYLILPSVSLAQTWVPETLNMKILGSILSVAFNCHPKLVAKGYTLAFCMFSRRS